MMRFIYIAVSCLLCGFPFCSFSLSEGDTDIIKKHNLVPNLIDSHEGDWAVKDPNQLKDKLRYRNQLRSVIDWRDRDHSEWLDFNLWKQERKFKDENSNWRTLLRNHKNSELIGRVIQCVGRCVVFRGADSAVVSFKSDIREGDEFITQKDSFSWILLMDGTLVRVSSETSISFNEYNISKSKNFFMIRLNRGQFHFQPKIKGEFQELDKIETDLGAYPVKVLKANRQYYSMKEYERFEDRDKISYSIVKNPGHISQYKELNSLVKKSNQLKWLEKDTEFLIYTPNLTIHGMNTIVDLTYILNKKSYLRYRKSPYHFDQKENRRQSLKVQMRGHNNDSWRELDQQIWYEVNRSGKMINEFLGNPILKSSVYFTKRTPTIHLVREYWIDRYAKDIQNEVDFEMMALKYGYRLWSDTNKEINSRIQFATEYIRRVETTNLNSLEKLYGKNNVAKLDNRFFTKAMHLHYDEAKKIMSQKNMTVRKMTKNEYYLWIIKYGNKTF